MMEKKFLLRLNQKLFNQIEELSGKKSVNEYLNLVIQNHIEQELGEGLKVEKLVIDELKVKEVREAVTVTQQEWYMRMLEKYNIYFFSPTKKVSPMMYIFFYGDSSCEKPNTISHIGKVSHIYRNVTKETIHSLPELKELLLDPEFSSEVLNWENYQIAVLSEVGELRNPICLTKEYVNHPRIIVNRTTTINKAFSASKIDELF
ncbi:hypothetical protein CQZ91_16845 [Bacillus cereus]|uniref:hypothetical protein n=2 Tax=Bacillus cereus group TaxID=86661 RepID=UPI0009B5CC57|nr:hypothetical protein [Bacillus cereus]PRC97503.1 hypothetical protein CQZ92_19930 [Bacillus cereus]PRD02778.1 hypothetical protein CQZ91_16845 [Bacillus cereus]HDR7900609.1 hypothetical protein [Bacillus cereus]